MRGDRVLQITYHSFRRGEASTFGMKPWYVKLFE